ncbi:MAG: DUF2958 domain-containing protein [bacterium]|nr:DUF2958 domain-containing protein [bacterium]
MKLLTETIRKQLLRNGLTRLRHGEQSDDDPDFLPVVKLFTPDAQCTWLLTELDPRNLHCGYQQGIPGLGCLWRR